MVNIVALNHSVCKLIELIFTWLQLLLPTSNFWTSDISQRTLPKVTSQRYISVSVISQSATWPGNQSPCYFFFCSSSSRLKFKVCDKIFTKKIFFYHLIFFFSTLVYSGQCQILSYCQSLLSSCNIINHKKIVSTQNKLFYTDLLPLREILP